MADVLKMAETDITDNLTIDDLEAWDSLKHMNLVVALEEEYDIEFIEEEIVEMMNLSQIKSIVLEKLT